MVQVEQSAQRGPGGGDPGDPAAPLRQASARAQAMVDAHGAAADPHVGYQLRSERGAASGYAALDSGGRVPAAQLPTSPPAHAASHDPAGSDPIDLSGVAALDLGNTDPSGLSAVEEIDDADVLVMWRDGRAQLVTAAALKAYVLA
jgi:hypothetical protein